MSESEKVKKLIKSNKKYSEDFMAQLESFKVFKKELDNAGLRVEDRYEVPLMHRIGVFKLTDNA